MDGPVVKAAANALDSEDVDLVLPFVPQEGEEEVKEAFAKVIRLRTQGGDVKELADRYFFENVVRIHRAGEGAAYTGLKPAGLGHGPVVPVAERAIETGSPDELVRLLTGMVEQETLERFEHVMQLKMHADGDLDANRAYVEAMLGLQVWSHSIYEALHASAHEVHQHEHAH